MSTGHWDGWAYEQVSGLQRDVALRTLSRLALEGSERVLDVGCGDGFITRAIAARVPDGSVVGIDASPGMIETALSREVPAGSDISFSVCDVLALPFDAEFDVVVSFNMLHWIVDQRAALAGMARAARREGRLIVRMVCAGDRPSVEDVATEISRGPRWAAAFPGFRATYLHVRATDFPDVAASAGLTVTEQEVEDLSWQFPTRADLADWCSVGFADWTAHLDPGSARQWVDDVVARYETLVGEPGLLRFMQLHAEMKCGPVTPAGDVA